MSSKGLPEGWKESHLSDIFFDPKNDIVDGPFGSNLKASEYQESGIPIIRIQNIERNSFINKNIKYVTPEKATQLKRHNYKVGDIIVTKLGDPLGKACIIPDTFEDGIIVADLVRARLNHNFISKKFLVYCINANDVAKQLKQKTKGTTRPRVNLGHIRNLKIKLPPLTEQQHIVARLEELFSDLDDGIASLKKAQEQLTTYRQAVLKYAFEGKLTAEWRKQRQPESAETLLKQIKTEREQQYQDKLEEWQQTCEQATAAGKKKPPKPKKPKDLPSLTEAELAELPELPEGWIYIHIDILLNIKRRGLKTGPFGTALKKSDHHSTGIPVLGIENIGNCRFIPGNKIFITESKAQELEAFDVLPGEIIISRSGTVGEICVVPENIGEARISTNLIRVSLNSKIINSRFFVYLFQGCSIIVNQVKELCKGSTRNFLNQAILNSLIFPLPNLSEQHQIVQEIEARLSICDQLEQTIADSLQKAESLRQSILKQAFEGKLTEPWRKTHPNLISGEHSAATLLEQIKAEKEKLKTERNSKQMRLL